MDQPNNVAQVILKSTPSPLSSSSSNLFYQTSSSSYNSDGGFFGNISFVTWIFIILFLAFLGFNIFVYLAKGTDAVTQMFAPILQFFLGTSVSVGGQIVDVSAEGAKKIVSETSGAAQDTLTAIQDITPNTTSSIKGNPYAKQPEDVIQKAPLNKALNSPNQTRSEYEADYADSLIQGGGKAGWCFIGQDRGYRSCAPVGANDTCLSGDIFPTHEICINPSLRR